MCVHVEVDVSEDAVPCIEADKDQGGQNSTRILHAGVRGGGTQDSNMDCEKGNLGVQGQGYQCEGGIIYKNSTTNASKMQTRVARVKVKGGRSEICRRGVTCQGGGRHHQGLRQASQEHRGHCPYEGESGGICTR